MRPVIRRRQRRGFCTELGRRYRIWMPEAWKGEAWKGEAWKREAWKREAWSLLGVIEVRFRVGECRAGSVRA